MACVIVLPWPIVAGYEFTLGSNDSIVEPIIIEGAYWPVELQAGERLRLTSTTDGWMPSDE